MKWFIPNFPSAFPLIITPPTTPKSPLASQLSLLKLLHIPLDPEIHNIAHHDMSLFDLSSCACFSNGGFIQDQQDCHHHPHDEGDWYQNIFGDWRWIPHAAWWYLECKYTSLITNSTMKTLTMVAPIDPIFNVDPTSLGFAGSEGMIPTDALLLSPFASWQEREEWIEHFLRVWKEREAIVRSKMDPRARSFVPGAEYALGVEVCSGMF